MQADIYAGEAKKQIASSIARVETENATIDVAIQGNVIRKAKNACNKSLRVLDTAVSDLTAFLEDPQIDGLPMHENIGDRQGRSEDHGELQVREAEHGRGPEDSQGSALE